MRLRKLCNEYLNYAEWVGLRHWDLVVEGLSRKEALQQASKEFHEEPEPCPSDDRLYIE